MVLVRPARLALAGCEPQVRSRVTDGVLRQATSRREVVRPARLERATSWFVARRSIQLSYGRLRTNLRLSALIGMGRNMRKH